MYFGFEPVFNSASNILILGSFPSVKSREISFYYGNPKNRFWHILESAYGEEIGESVYEKKEFLFKHNLALWDIVKTCEIKGSSDSDLKCLQVVDLNIILSQTKIQKILCNGTKAYQLLVKHYPNLKTISVCLPSTSPANFSFKGELWKTALLNKQ